jgi:hypothetical protein
MLISGSWFGDVAWDSVVDFPRTDAPSAADVLVTIPMLAINTHDIKLILKNFMALPFIL